MGYFKVMPSKFRPSSVSKKLANALTNDELAMIKLIITQISKRIPPADLDEKNP